MKVTKVVTHILLDPGYDKEATSSNQDTIVVEVETDEGITGIGETDLNAWVARACIEAPGTHTMDRGLGQMLIGRDPTDPAARWDELYVGTAMTGRRGALVHALGAIDIALWDIAGKAAGVPTWKLLGAPRPEGQLTPYASLLPSAGSDWEAFAAAIGGQAIAAAREGFRAGKLEETQALLRELVVTDFKLRYQNSVLGYLWSLLRPLLLSVTLYIVFVKFLKISGDIRHYASYLLLGIMSWTFFIEVTMGGVGAVVGSWLPYVFASLMLVSAFAFAGHYIGRNASAHTASIDDVLPIVMPTSSLATKGSLLQKANLSPLSTCAQFAAKRF